MPYQNGEKWKGNANGRPKVPEIQLFRDAIAKVQKEKKTSLLEHAVRRAYEEDNVLIALLKKILPDKMDVDVQGQGRFVLICHDDKESKP